MLKNIRLETGELHLFTRSSLWYVICAKENCDLAITTSGNNVTLTIPAGHEGLLLNSHSSMKIMSGGLAYTPYNYAILAKLQFFLDLINGEVNNNHIVPHACFIDTPKQLHCCSKDLQYWFINDAARNKGESQPFRNLLRTTECYQLVRFLYQSTDEDSTIKLNQMSSQYGLSAAHFRRLTRQALGDTTKVQLRNWRLARALLDVANNKKDITTIALDNGYSSVSHFSSEVKKSLGISPGKIKKVFESKIEY